MFWIAMTFAAASAIGVIVLAIQRTVLWWTMRRPAKTDGGRPPISIFKPMAGVDDDLEENLLGFVNLDYPEYEVILGVKDANDKAYPIGLDFVKRFPHRFRLVLQEGSPGHNPKVNQLATMEKHAKYDIFLVSDSNSRARDPYLKEIGTLFDDPQVVCVSNPVSGTGHVSTAALADNLHLAATVGIGQLASKAFANKDLVVGKSMAMRRSALEQLGGFKHYANALAEDYVIGVDIPRRLGAKVAIARTPVWNYAVRKSKRAFVRRYARWAVIHRTAVTLPTSIGQALLNPWPISLVALALWPTREMAALTVVAYLAKLVCDVTAAWSLECRNLGLRVLWILPLKDLIIFGCWARALVVRTVDWRGNRLRVTYGSQLVDADGKPFAPPA